MNIHRLATGIVLVAVLLAGCQRGRTTSEVVEIDLSTSAVKGGVVDEGVEVARQRLSRLTAPGTLTVTSFARSSALTSQCEPVVISLPERDSARERKRDRLIATARFDDEIAAHIECARAESGDRASDVLGALTQAATLLDPDADERRAYIVSDGIVSTADLTIDRSLLKDDAWIGPTLTRLAEAGLIPDLSADLTMVGLAQGSSMTTEQALVLQTFWEAVASRANARWTPPSTSTKE